jgi:Family of unknown function (DUF5357)
VKLFLSIYEWLQKTFRPPSAFSWETMIFLSIFSYYMVMLASSAELKGLLTNFGWIFLIIGVHWGTTSANQLRIGYDDKIPRDGFPVSPWITGVLVSLYIFGGAWNGEIRREALIYWPTISAFLAIMPDFLGETPDGGLTFKKAPLDQRQNMVVLVGTNLLLSCWFQFHYVAQDWLAQYPSLLADNFNNSSFVTKFQTLSSEKPRGALLLETMEPKLSERLNGKPWPEVERLLLKEQRNKLVDQVQQQSTPKSSTLDEDEFWQVEPIVSSRKGGGYNFNLQANWLGPRAQPKKYSMVKPCQITQVATPAKSPATKPINAKQGRPGGTPFSRFKCDQVQGWGINKSTVANDTFIR